ncbi:Tab2/Atab2 family RNA-binding protein [Lusitaniella coriacea LEGE 07157]|uniref:Tab2/Atab2 family RNA-binding protein n=1 Tax=Lusitaniella coriacea LEGE 07157 TaxID=945747 RepID=A0A8J7JB90_9CYAN|nr:Tab2/Atab2 family RNA-binding protein [Lusitaniella coriacea]MBE9116830.1 Tab2/Atab2 family RNA-binding protein [Lusitaniella coriacea LEGE 07157]
MGKTIWELDFYSRPIFNEEKKKVWEVLICESPLDGTRSRDSLFRYEERVDSKNVNSIRLQEILTNAIAQAPAPPSKIRFFRRQMNNMILKACEGLDIPAAQSRRTYFLRQWLEERLETVYPQEPGYDESAAQAASVQYPPSNAVPLPDKLRGDRADKWAFVTLEAEAFEEMNEWEIGFGESFPLSLLKVEPDARIPGLIVFSPRALPIAAWMSDLELSFLQFEGGSFPRIRLETGVSDSWILANLTNEQTIAEAKGFEQAKDKANKVHFLALQSSPEAQSFAGFWLMAEV